jgi:phenylalanyl-tRNA synthetase beta chain
VNLNRDRLFAALGKQYTEREFDELCFEFGIELDEVTSEKEMNSKFLGKEKEEDDTTMETAGETGADGSDVIYKIDIPANRYDLLCHEGISKALNVFLGRCPTPTFRLVEPVNGAPRQKMIQKPETLLVRPFIVCAVLRGIKFDQARYDSFIDLQDKLHQNICRKRTLVAIGTHDLSTVTGPFTYEAHAPEDIEFVPLKQSEKFTAAGLMEHYKTDQKLKHFLHILEGSAVFPVLYDANRVVLSLPPLINGAHSAISLETTDVLIECTATDLNKAKIVLNTMVAAFSQYSATEFAAEPVDVVDAMGQSKTYPDFMTRFVEADPAYINKRIGVNIEARYVLHLQIPPHFLPIQD